MEYAGDVPYQVVGVPVLFCEGADEVLACVLFFTVGELLYYEIFRELSYGSAGARCGGGVYCYACVLFEVGGCWGDGHLVCWLELMVDVGFCGVENY